MVQPDSVHVRRALRAVADPARASISQRFFKTGPGEYAEGATFIGVTVPQIRKLVREYAGLSLAELRKLLRSPMHEERLFALLVLVRQYQRGDARARERIFRLYIAQCAWINNWDLVDSSAEHIVGAHCRDGDRALLYRLAESDDLWERRIAIMATFHYIKQNDFRDTLRLARVLLADEHDLIHKAVGWMLREVGNRDRRVEEEFLKKYYRKMPRTMLRYAIEKFPESRRQDYLKEKL